MTNVLSTRGYSDAFLRPVLHGVGMEHEEARIPGGHAVIHGEEKVDHVEAGMMLAIGNCGIYREQFGVRAEDTVWVSPDGPIHLCLPQAITRIGGSSPCSGWRRFSRRSGSGAR